MVKTRIRKFDVEFGINPSEVYLLKYAPGDKLLNAEPMSPASARALADALYTAANQADASTSGV